MAVTLLHSPAEVSFSKNPILFEFKSDRAVIDPGSYFIGYLYFFNSSQPGFTGPAEGSVLIFTLYNTVEVFTFKAAGNGDNNELPTKSSTESTDAWFVRLINAFKKNFILNNNYNLSFDTAIEYGDFDVVVGDSGHYMRIQSKEKNSIANVELKNESVSIAGMSNTSQARSVEYEVNLRIYAELWINNSDTFQKLIGATLATDQNGLARWDVSALLNDALENQLTLLDQLNDIVVTNDTISYYLKYTEVFGNNLTVGSYNSTETKLVLYGGQNVGDFKKGGLSLLKDGAVSKFLAFEPSTILLPNQPQFLSWFNQHATGLVTIKARINYANGTYWVYDLKSIQVSRFQKITFPVDFERIYSINQFSSDRITSYSIYLVNADGLVSDEMISQVDYKRHPYAKTWAYRNSLGAYETIVTYGEKTFSYAIRKYQAQIINDFDKSARSQDFDIELNDQMTVYTGYRTKSEIEKFKDFFLSSEKYFLDNGKWIPVNLSTGSIESYSDNDSLYGFAFEVELQHRTTIWNK